MIFFAVDAAFFTVVVAFLKTVCFGAGLGAGLGAGFEAGL